MNRALPIVEAVAAKGERIVKVGTTKEVSLLIGKSTEVLDLEGRAVLPGLIDTHIHVADFARLLLWVDLTATNSISYMQRLLQERISKVEKSKWIVGKGWNESRFAEMRLPTRFDLDNVAPENPVIFYHESGQVAVVNSKALDLAAITKQMYNPSGGVVDRDAKSGEPTGILRERATNLVWRLIPEPSIDELANSASNACEKIMQNGVTSIHWLAESDIDLVILRRLIQSRLLPLRVFIIVPPSLMNKLVEFASVDRVKIGGVEVCVDGFLASRTAALFKPYTDVQKSGDLLLSKEELDEAARVILGKGFQLIIHAMGDKAVDFALKSMESLDAECRMRIDPAALLSKVLIERLRKQKVVVSVQPLVAASEFSVYRAEEYLGEQRTRWLYPIRTLLQEGVCVCGGSDCPMEPLSPMLAIQSAVTRQAFPEEQISVDEALRIYTVNAAWASGEENEKGTIEEGKFADFTILSQDPELTPLKLHDLVIEGTIVGGIMVYSR